MRYIGGGTGPIFLDRVACSGNEERLIDCRHREFGVHSCNHRYDAGVFCLPREQTGIYLNVNVSSYNNGITSLTSLHREIYKIVLRGIASSDVTDQTIIFFLLF